MLLRVVFAPSLIRPKSNPITFPFQSGIFKTTPNLQRSDGVPVGLRLFFRIDVETMIDANQRPVWPAK